MTALIIGLTGGIGSGKSLTAELFREQGASIIDADQIARDIVKPGMPAYQAILKSFSKNILNNDQTLNRSQLRQLIFQDPSLKKKLESILHPLIRNNIKTAVSECKTPYCILVIPLLIENGRYNFIDRIAVIDCDELLQCQRASQRDQLPSAEIERIIGQQATRQQRLKAADDVIDNTGNQTQLQAQVSQLHEQYLRLAKAKK